MEMKGAFPMAIHHSITELIGHTPLLELTNYEQEQQLSAEVVVKLEYFNPNQSVKDRIANAMIEDAERRGLLHKGDTIVETTSGNTGIGLAAIAAAKGYKFRVYIQDQVSEERFRVIHAFGGETIKLGDDPELARILEATQGDFVAACHALHARYANKRGYFFVDQVSNPANPDVHRRTTGPEIWQDTEGKVDILVAAVGTGGTISGTGAYLKAQNPALQVVAVQPGPDSIPTPEHPAPETEITGVHAFEGVDDARVPATLDRQIYDEVLSIEGEDAIATARAVAKSDGILIGTSSGAAIHAATLLARRPENRGKRIVVVLADTGLRYLSTNLFADSEEAEEELPRAVNA